MEENLTAFINEFIESEKTRAYRETELYGRLVLGEFTACMQKYKGPDWKLEEISMPDFLVYYDHLSTCSETEHYARLAQRTINRFVRFSLQKGVLKGKDWEELERELVKKGL